LTPKRIGFPALSAAIHEKENVGRVLMTVGDVVKEAGVVGKVEGERLGGVLR